jgi:hypothetical protein
MMNGSKPNSPSSDTSLPRGRCHATAGVLFPLTPALSHWERENRLPLGCALGALRQVTARSGQPEHRNVREGRKLFPLPEGEGQGEGNEALRIGRRCTRPTINSMPG